MGTNTYNLTSYYNKKTIISILQNIKCELLNKIYVMLKNYLTRYLCNFLLLILGKYFN